MEVVCRAPGRVAQLCAWALAGLAASTPAAAEPHQFELVAPAAQAVWLAGEMTDWDLGKRPLHRDADGIWRLRVDLDPGEWVYKFVVDGRWVADPGTADHDADGQGGQHSFVFIGQGPWSERADVPKGRVDTRLLRSTAWGKPMKVHVYLPPGYAAGQALPVLWLLHGRGMDADQWLRTGHIDRYMDNLIADRAIRPFAIVMPSSEDVPYSGRSERFIAGELRAWLLATYGLRTERDHAGVAGMSMGGTGALRLPLEHPELYGFGLALSGYFGDDLIAAVPKQGGLPMQLLLRCGSADDLVATNRALVRALDAGGAKYSYREAPGAHTWQYWSHQAADMLRAADAYFTTGNIASAAPR